LPTRAAYRGRSAHRPFEFPEALHSKLYPAPGAPALARQTADLVQKAPVALDEAWGLDHGTWSVLARMFPRADIPVFQLSLEATRAPAWHYDLAGELRPLRERGVLIMGSGNIVHNLRRISRQLLDTGFDWAIEFDASLTELIDKGDHRGIIDYPRLGRAAQLSVPTNEHTTCLCSMRWQSRTRGNPSCTSTPPPRWAASRCARC
jgi:4,5-DOPA dioxygenase extradiol